MRKRKAPEERFWTKVKKTESCWLWQGHTQNYGYGVLFGTTKNILAHRLSYTMHKGEIPPGEVIMHTCDNPPCVNPEHLKLGTLSDNVQDMLGKGRGFWQKREMKNVQT